MNGTLSDLHIPFIWVNNVYFLDKNDCKYLYVKSDSRPDFTAWRRSRFHLIHHVVLTTITILQRNIHSRYLSILLGKVFAQDVKTLQLQGVIMLMLFILLKHVTNEWLLLKPLLRNGNPSQNHLLDNSILMVKIIRRLYDVLLGYIFNLVHLSCTSRNQKSIFLLLPNQHAD